MPAFQRILTEIGEWCGRADRGQRSPKDKQTVGVGVHRYVSPTVCAVSQTPCEASYMPLIRQKSKIFATFSQEKALKAPNR